MKYDAMNEVAVLSSFCCCCVDYRAKVGCERVRASFMSDLTALCFVCCCDFDSKKIKKKTLSLYTRYGSALASAKHMQILPWPDVRMSCTLDVSNLAKVDLSGCTQASSSVTWACKRYITQRQYPSQALDTLCCFFFDCPL
ncbi:hypothetical protein PZA11_006465 [Diplocarpon coronariae]